MNFKNVFLSDCNFILAKCQRPMSEIFLQHHFQLCNSTESIITQNRKIIQLKKKTKLHINVKIFSCVFLELTCWKCRRSRKKLNEACFQSKQRDTIFGVRLLTKKSSRSLINSCIKCLTWSKAWRVLELMWSHKHSENSECWLLWIAQTLSALTEKVKTKFRN